MNRESQLPINERKCRCGHGITHPMVHPDPKFTISGLVLLFMGASPTPTHTVYSCGRCLEALGITRDPKVLREFS